MKNKKFFLLIVTIFCLLSISRTKVNAETYSDCYTSCIVKGESKDSCDSKCKYLDTTSTTFNGATAKDTKTTSTTEGYNYYETHGSLANPSGDMIYASPGAKPGSASSSTSSPKQFNYTLLESFPGFFNAKDTLTDLPTLVLAIYKFGIWTVGIAGLFMIVIGGIMYMGSAGNTSTIGSAKDIIWDAIYGIIGALTAYLFLYVINPDFTKMNFNFTPIGVYAVMDTSNPKGSTQCYNCVSVVDMCKENPCSLNKTLAEKLKVALQGQNARITEGWPATTNHSSSCHGNGTCADVNLTTNKGDVQAVKKLYDAIKAAGLNPVYESTNCTPYTNAGVYCKYYPTMTYPSFHVNM